MSARLGEKKRGGLAQKSGMLTDIRMQSFELFRLYDGIYSPALQLKSPHKSPYTRIQKIRLLPRLPGGLSLYLFGDAHDGRRERKGEPSLVRALE